MKRLSLTTVVLAALWQMPESSMAQGADPAAAPPSAASVEGWGKIPKPIDSGPTYSEEEQRGLGACANLTDQVFIIANSKRRGDSAAQVKQRYETWKGPLAEMMPSVVDQVYAHQDIRSDWDHAQYRFVSCAMHIPVPPPRIELAQTCMDRRMVASVAWGARMHGQAKEDLYQQFGGAQFRRDSTRALIDDIYARHDPIVETRLAIWNACIVVDLKKNAVLYVR